MTRLSDEKFWVEFKNPEQLVALAAEIDEHVSALKDSQFPSYQTLMQGKMVVNLFIVVTNKRADLLMDVKDENRAKVKLFWNFDQGIRD